MSINSIHSNDSFLPSGLVIRPLNLVTPVSIVIPKGASGVLLGVEGNAIRLTFGSQIPSSVIGSIAGILIPPTNEPIRLDLLAGLKFQVVEASSDPAANRAFLTFQFITIRS